MTEVANIPETTEKLKESAAELVDALGLLAQGKRNMVCGEVPQACNQLQEACRLLAKKYGETANECGEAYLCYGKALLDLSRMESGVLGNALQGIEDEDEESDDKSSEDSDKVEDPEKTPAEERGKISDQVIDAMLETDEELKKRLGDDNKEDKKAETNGVQKKEESNGVDNKDETKEVQKNGETNGVHKNGVSDSKEEAKSEIQVNGEDASAKVDVDEEKMETDEKKEAESEELNTEEEGDTEEEEGEEAKDAMEEGEAKDTEEEGETKEGEEGKAEKDKKKDDEDDVTNLQLAWEMLELAKIIYKRDDTKENKLKLAEAFLKLGEVGLETEQYDQAISDFNECLKIQKSVLDGNDRYLAETQHQLGVANTYACKYQEAIDNYKAAGEVIKLKLESLNKVIEEHEKESKGKAPAEADDPIVKTRKEISELKDILPDIMQKIDDVVEERKSADVAKAMIKDTVSSLAPGVSKAFESTSSTEVSTSSSSTKSGASDITHLVRKKRKSDEGKEVRDDAKKSKIDGSGDA